MTPEHDLFSAFDDIARGAARTTRGPGALDPQVLVDTARRRRRRLVAVTAATSAAAVVAIGGVGVAMTLDDAPPSLPAGTGSPLGPAPTEPVPAVAEAPATGSVGADACGRPLAELPWRADDRGELGSDAGPRLDGTALQLATRFRTGAGHWMIAADQDAVVLDSSGFVVAYLAGATSNQSVTKLTDGTLVPCRSGTDTLPPGTYALVAAQAFVELTSSGQPIGATPAHAVQRWDLVVPAGHADAP